MKSSADFQLSELLRRTAGGDALSFDALYLQTASRVLARVRRIVGDAHAEDVLAEVYFQVWHRAPQYDPENGTPLSWLMVIARKHAFARLRQERLRTQDETSAQLPADGG